MSYVALKGIRVLDLGIITAGASTSAILADLGAEVIKVEGPSYTDSFREWSGRSDSARWWNEGPQFNATNRNKRSLCLELKSPAGREIFLDLVRQSDIVLENFRAGTLDRLGLGFERLSAVNDRIIVASISSQGATGPKLANVSFGSTLEASSGMASLMRYPGEAPQITGRAFNYPDQVASLFAAGSILAALVERERTGRAVMLDLSQRELTSYLVGEALLAAADGLRPDPYPVGAPALEQGIFKSADGDRIAVTISKNETMEAFAAQKNTPAETTRSWIERHPSATVVATFRAAGAAAEIVRAERGRRDPDPLRPANAFGVDSLGREVKGLPLRLGAEDRREFTAMQDLGAANADVAMERLGLDAERYRLLVEAGVFSDRPGERRKPRVAAQAPEGRDS